VRIELERNDMMKAARKQGMSKADAQLWVYGELDRLYPPQPSADTVRPYKPLDDGSGDNEARTVSGAQRPVDDGQIQGLGDIPGDWPELSPNASLPVEIGWVQANRLRIVEERSGGAARVHLDQALSPAPSWAALGWLETSVRSYAKYVDVAARITASDDGEAEVMRRERMAIEEVRALLDEMRAEG
jgi:hypothetical protein